MRTAPRKARTGTAALGSHRPEPRGPAQWEPQPRASSPKPRTARESQPQESGPRASQQEGARRPEDVGVRSGSPSALWGPQMWLWSPRGADDSPSSSLRTDTLGVAGTDCH